MKKMGCIHIYYGDGKGKTTAAAGLALRAAGRGLRVLFVQFLKDNDSGERKAMRQISNITCYQGRAEEKFVFQMSAEEKEQTRKYCESVLDNVTAEAENYDVIILDEVICAIQTMVLDEQKLLEIISRKPEATELVLTGNSPSEELLKRADYVTQMVKIKHPYDQGMIARKGIEL